MRTPIVSFCNDFLWRASVAVLLVASCTALADIGRIEAGNGDIKVIADDGTVKTGVVGVGLAGGDTVSTAGEQSWAVLRMEDGASFTLRPNSRMHIDKYQYDEANPGNSRSWLSLVQGSLRAITGLIGRQNPNNYALHTPTATIGIRGTDHETVVVDEEHASAHVPAGTYDSVNDGETVMHNDHGDVSIKPGKVGFLQHGGGAAPRMLNYRPAFFERFRNFERRQGISGVLGRIHQSVGKGAFTAHPDLKERLKREMSQPPVWRNPRSSADGVKQPMAASRGQFRQRQGAIAAPGMAAHMGQRRGGAMAPKQWQRATQERAARPAPRQGVADKERQLKPAQKAQRNGEKRHKNER